LIRDLIRDEGLRLEAYRDSEGHLTIGVGRLIDPPGGLNEEEARYLLNGDIDRAMRGLDAHRAWWRDLPEPAQRALLNMAFNLGIRGVLKFQRMLAALRRRNYEAAARECLDSRWAGQVGERAERIAALYRECDE